MTDATALLDEPLVWESIETAPKDGTVVWGRNPVMQEPAKMSWGEYTASWGKTYTDWRTEFTKHGYFPVLPGRLIRPTEWSPVSPSNPTLEGK